MFRSMSLLVVIAPLLVLLTMRLQRGTPERRAGSEPAAFAGQKRSGVVAGHGRVSLDLLLPEGKLSTITLHGDGETDLDASLLDEGGHLIDSDTDALDYSLLRVVPRRTGRFTVVIRNQGADSNRYVLRQR
jgi:hypothetical protein